MKWRMVAFLCIVTTAFMPYVSAEEPEVEAASEERYLLQDIVFKIPTFYSDIDGENAEKEIAARESTATRYMRNGAFVGLIISLISLPLLWRQAKKRKRFVSMLLTYIFLIGVFVDCLLFFNVVRWVYPFAVAAAIIYPFYYFRLHKYIHWLPKTIVGLFLVLLCMASFEYLHHDEFVLFIIPNALAFFGINIVLYTIFVLNHDFYRCPLCFYYGDHDMVREIYNGEDESSSTESWDQHTHDTVSHEGSTKVITQHYRKRYKVTHYRNKYYTLIFSCLRCQREFSRNRVETKEIGHETY